MVALRPLLTVALVCSVAGAMLVSCARNDGRKPPGGRAVDDQVRASTELHRTLANALNERMGGRAFHVVPILGRDYEYGTLMDPQYGGTLSRDCMFDASELLPPGDVPIPIDVTTSHIASLNAALPSEVVNFLRGSVSAGAGAGRNRTINVKLYDLKVVEAPLDAVKKRITQQPCLDALGDIVASPKVIIRGKVLGKIEASSSRQVTVNANVRAFDNDVFTVRYEDSGAFKIESTKEVPLYFIVAKVDGRRTPLELLGPPLSDLAGDPDLIRERVMEFLRTNPGAVLQGEDREVTGFDMLAGEPVPDDPEFVVELDVSSPSDQMLMNLTRQRVRSSLRR